ncbi:MAG: dTMP kinase [Pseudomonadota bacterium]
MKIARFLTVEGGEGVGKSSFIELLSHRLRDKGMTFALTREPGGTRIADEIRSVFSKGDDIEEFTPEGEFLLVSAARAQHVFHKIRPELERGRWIICDRFADSSRVYQGILKGVETDFMERVIQKSTYGLIPDLTFLLDCDVSVSQSRVAGRGLVESRYDLASLEVHEQLRQGYLQVSRMFPHRIQVLDASRPREEIVNQAISLMEERFHD